jgi:hypothetical protein
VAGLGGGGVGGSGGGVGGGSEPVRRGKWRRQTPLRRPAVTSAIASVPQPPSPEPSLAIVPLFADNNNTGGLSVLDELIATRGYDPQAIDDYFRMNPLAGGLLRNCEQRPDRNRDVVNAMCAGQPPQAVSARLYEQVP